MKVKATKWLVLGAILIFTGCTEQKVIQELKGENYGSLAGKAMLEDATDGGYEGILIILSGTSFSAFTDPSGNWSIMYAKPGTYTVIAKKDGYVESRVENIEVRAGEVTQVPDITLKKVPAGSIKGKVTLEGASTGNEGIIVFLLGTSYFTTTADDGTFELTDIPPGNYTLIATHSGYTSARVENITIQDKSTTILAQINLQKTQVSPTGQEYGGISGRVTLNGAQTGNGDIAVFIVGTSYVAYTADDGSYTISMVPPGTYSVRVIAPEGYQPAQINGVTVVQNQITGGVDFDLQPSAPTSPSVGSIEGYVYLDGTSSGNSGAVVFLEGTSYSAYTDDSGHYVIQDVSPGSYTLVAYKSGYATASTQVVVIAGETTQVPTLSLNPTGGGPTTGNVEGYVYLGGTPSGNSGVVVFLQGTSFSAYTDDSGHYLISGVYPGSYTLTAYKTGYTIASTDVVVNADQTTNVPVLTLNPAGGTPGNNPPYVSSSPVTTVYQDDTYSYQINAVDPEGDPISYSLVVAPEGMNITADGLITWKPVFKDTLKEHPVIVYIADNQGNYIYHIFQIKVLSRWRTYTTYDGLMSDNIGSVLIDSSSNIWVQNGDGLSVITPAESVTNYTRNSEGTPFIPESVRSPYYGRAEVIPEGTVESYGYYYSSGYYYLTITDTTKNYTPDALTDRGVCVETRYYYSYRCFPIVGNTPTSITFVVDDWRFYDYFSGYDLTGTKYYFTFSPNVRPWGCYVGDCSAILTLKDPSQNWTTDSMRGMRGCSWYDTYYNFCYGYFYILSNTATTLTVSAFDDYILDNSSTSYYLPPFISYLYNSSSSFTNDELLGSEDGFIVIENTQDTLTVYGTASTNTTYILNTGLGGSVSHIEEEPGSGKIYAITDKGLSEFDGTKWRNLNKFNTGIKGRVDSVTYGFTGEIDEVLPYYNTVIVDADASLPDGALEGHYILIENGYYSIYSNSATQITLASRLAVASGTSLGFPAPGDSYSLSFDNTITITDNSANFPPNLSGKKIWINGNTFTIVLNTATTVTFQVQDWYYEDPWGSPSRWGQRKIQPGDIYFIFTGIPPVSLTALSSDGAGNLYIGTYGAGIAKYNGTQFSFITVENTSNGLRSNYIQALDVVNSDRFWVSYQSSSRISLFTLGTWQTFTTQNTLCGSFTPEWLREDSSGVVWMGGDIYRYWDVVYCGVTSFDGTNWTTYTVENTESATGRRDGLGSNNVRAICEDVDYDLWFATRGGVSRLKGTTWKRFFEYINTGAYETGNSGLASDNVYDVDCGSTGRKCFATGKGLSCYSGD